ncbi:MAG: hypothetical protein ACK52K_12290 [Alphaproteobacteria bacterium]|jgi:hypothetical protein
MITENLKPLLRAVTFTAVRAVCAGAVWAGAITVGQVLVPAAHQSGLDFVQKQTEYFNAYFVPNFLITASHGVSVFLLFAIWFRHMNIRGAVVFGFLSGTYGFALLPPIDLVGGAVDFLPGPPWIGLIPLAVLLAVFPALALVSDRLTRQR